ncbi:MAG: hypothetical protein ABI969_15695 [bacterium]
MISAKARSQWAATDLARLNQRPTAMALLTLNLEFYDKSALTYQSMAQVLLQDGDTASAKDALNKAIGLQLNNPQQLRQLLQRLGVTPWTLGWPAGAPCVAC